MIADYFRLCHTLVMTVSLAFLAGCAKSEPSPVEMDRSPFTGNPCSAPCWHGLVVGKSSESDVRSTLSTLRYIDPKSIQYIPRTTALGLQPDSGAQGVEIYANCIQPHRPCLTLNVADGVLAQIDMSLNYSISAREAIADLGPPDYVGTQLMGAETVTCQVEFICYSKQLVLNSEPSSWHSSDPKDFCVIVQDTGKTTTNLVISDVSYKTIPWIEYTLSQSGSEFFRYSGTIQE